MGTAFGYGLGISPKGCEVYADLLGDMAFKLDMALDLLDEKDQTIAKLMVTSEGNDVLRDV